MPLPQLHQRGKYVEHAYLALCNRKCMYQLLNNRMSLSIHKRCRFGDEVKADTTRLPIKLFPPPKESVEIQRISYLLSLLVLCVY